MKENDVDIAHLNAIAGAFLDCDQDRTGTTTKKDLYTQIADLNLQFPANFLFQLTVDMQEDPSDESETAVLKFDKFKQIMEVYQNCPLFLKGDSNNSDSFKASMDRNKDLQGSQDRLDKLFRYVHVRIEEKYKDFRQAFRGLDKDFGGSLDFKEFVVGCEQIGIRLKLEDFKLIFEAIDYDNKGDIDFTKFCLLNTDRKINIKALKEQSASQKSDVSGSIHSKNSKPPLARMSVTGSSVSGNPLFGDGNIPKNKDLSKFVSNI